jgi:hypothetical protein
MVYCPLGSFVEPTVTAWGSVTVTVFGEAANSAQAIKPPPKSTGAHVRPAREKAFFILVKTFLFLWIRLARFAFVSSALPHVQENEPHAAVVTRLAA